MSNSKFLFDKIGGKKSLHVAIKRANHAALKLECTKRDLSMQEVIEAFSHKMFLEDSKFLSFLDEVALNKTLKIKNDVLGRVEIDNIYSIIESDDDKDE